MAILAALAVASFALETYSDVKRGQAEADAARRKAKALEEQAQRRLAKGKEEADFINQQYEREKTVFAASLGANARSGSVIQTGLEALTNRAMIESEIAMEDAAYESRMIREDAAEYRSSARDTERSIPFSVGANLLNAGSKYYSANDRSSGRILGRS